MNMQIDWLLEGEPFIEHRTRRDLLDQPENSPQVLAARKYLGKPTSDKPGDRTIKLARKQREKRFCNRLGYCRSNAVYYEPGSQVTK